MDQQDDLTHHQFGKYRVERPIGEGGFAKVYMGTHIYMNNQVAIKVLNVRLDAESVAAFLNEARTIASLDHPHIVRVLDCDVEHKTPYLVMSYAPNGSLRHCHRRGERVLLDLALSYAGQVADALQYAHDQRIIHRDVKPENMLIGKNHEILLSDFGIALVGQSSQVSRTQDVTGTVTYMAPEQIQGKPVRATDQYALAVTLYEWLAGEPPFRGSLPEMYAQHLTAEPPPLDKKVFGLPPNVTAAIHRALSKQPDQRFPTIAAFAQALKDPNYRNDPASNAGNLASTVSASTQYAGKPPVEPTVKVATETHTPPPPRIDPAGARMTPPGSGPQPPPYQSGPAGAYNVPPVTTGPQPYSQGPQYSYPPQQSYQYHHQSFQSTYMPPPRKRKKNPIGLLVGVILGSIVVLCIFSSVMSSFTKSFNTNNSSTDTTQSDVFAKDKGTQLYAADWSKNSNGWRLGGQWKYANGTIASDGTAARSDNYLNPINPNYFLPAPFLPPSSDYIIETKIQYNNTTDVSTYPVDTQVGIFFRTDSSHNGYIANVTSGGWHLYRYEGGNNTSLASDYGNELNTTPHTYSIKVKGNTIAMAIDGQVVGQVTDNRFSRAGMIGLIDAGNDINVSSFAVYQVAS
ncbi:serine/threonine protein kinase [Dictyobacter formicarum]|uniref:non-specific serine/threonine protein kinase n=1 Tax=Dictyobacter formicarum TaxID=2778368 RepID=A0ABQ3VS36_9CHLR|nr:serine/threonine-protein kinase [Dictyobacter formicarum]GHO88715.1 hypothetical protein KSZ_67210 [Dictyobacter formicarum]